MYCSFLTELPYISEWNTTNVTNISGIFGGCISLQYLPDISKWDTLNVIIWEVYLPNSHHYYLYLIFLSGTQINSMNSMFNGCL